MDNGRILDIRSQLIACPPAFEGTQRMAEATEVKVLAPRLQAIQITRIVCMLR